MKNNATDFDVGLLIPKFEILFDGNLTCLDALSALIVSFLLFVFLSALLYLFWQTILSFKSIYFLQKLLRDLTPQNVVIKRRDIKYAAYENKRIGPLWEEFDGSLVELHEEKRLCNTLDAGYFFNARSLARSITDSRLVSAVPGFLTAIGVIGTFAGLQIGLSGLDLSSEGIKDASSEIGRLISSAAVAFLTSVWGITTSLTFNFTEKLLERLIRKRISKLQLTIDSLFPRINAEQTLLHIQEHSQQSRETLQGLAERIGSKMQEAMIQVSGEVRSGLNDILRPAIDKMVEASVSLTERQKEGAEEALKALIITFSEGLGKEANNQRELMENASGDLRGSISAMSKDMNEFLGGLKEQLGELNKNQRELNKNTNDIVNANIDASKKVIGQGQILAQNTKVNQDAMDNAAKQISEASNHLEKASKNLFPIADRFHNATETFSNALMETNRTTARLIEENTKTGTNINQVLGIIEKLRNDFGNVSSELKESAIIARTGLNDISEKHNLLIKALNNYIIDLEGKIAKLLTDYADQVQGQTEERLREWNKQTQVFTTTMKESINVIAEIVDDMEGKIGKVK